MMRKRERRPARFYRPNRTVVATGPEDVVWENASQMTVDGNDLTSTGDPGTAQSQQTFTEGDYIEFVVPEASPTFTLLGLETTQNTIVTNYFQCQLTILSYYAGDVYQGEVAYSAGDTLRLSIESGALVFSRNGAALHSSPAFGSGPFYACTYIAGVGEQILNAVKGTV